MFQKEVTLFVHPVSKKLLCMLCGNVFKEPIIASCGVSRLLFTISVLFF